MDKIEYLKKDLQLKKNVLFSIRDNKQDHKKILKNNFEIFSYFKKFRDPSEITRNFMMGNSERRIFNFYPGWFNQIEEDLQRLEREIEKKENRLEQKVFLKKQQEFLDMQKEDIGENKKDRKKLNNFTFILALGILATIIFYISQIFIQFKTSPTLHILLFTGICCLGLILLFIFIMNTFEIKEELIKFWNKSWPLILFLGFLIALFGYFMLTLNDKPTTMSQEGELGLISQTNYEIQHTNNLLNKSLYNQKNTNIKLDTIILNQKNDS